VNTVTLPAQPVSELEIPTVPVVNPEPIY
jgi:hypothetical protein